VGSAPAAHAYGEFTAHAFRDKPSQAVHLALVKGQWDARRVVPVRVHEPLSVLDALEVNRSMHSWGLDTSLHYLASQGKGVAVLLNCGESAEQLLAQFEGTARAAQAPERGRMDLRTYGVGAQILRECGVHRMQLMGQPRRMPSMAGYGLEITGLHPQGIINMFGADKGTADRWTAAKLHIGIVQARFNEGITNALAAGLPGRAAGAGRAGASTSRPCAGARRAGGARGAAGHGRKRRIRRADRAGLHHPRRDLPLRTGGQRIGAGVTAWRWTTSCPSPTPSSPPKTWSRPLPARPTRAATPPAWPWKWPTCWTNCHDRSPHTLRPRHPPHAHPAVAHRQSTGARKAAPSPTAAARANSRCRRCTSTWWAQRRGAIDSFTRDLAGFHKADAAHYDACCTAASTGAADLDALITPLLDRKMAEISPIEHATMWIGVYEFQHCLDVPWRVVLNECIELAKEFGGTDGHKYVNACSTAWPPLRAAEVAADKRRSAGPACPPGEPDAGA
jgi:GTP cyclohydrolase II/transcription termination factor NusB